MAPPQPLRRSTRQAVTALNARYSDHTTQSSTSSSTGSEEDEPLKKRQKQKAAERLSAEDEDQPRLPSPRPQTNFQSPSAFTPSSSVQSGSSLPAFNLAYPLRDFGFPHSFLQCMLICALKHIKTTEDDAPLTDDTVSLVLAYQYGAHTEPVDTAAVYQFLRVTAGDRSNYAVQRIWLHLRAERHSWARTALACYWNWMEYMKGIWNQ